VVLNLPQCSECCDVLKRGFNVDPEGIHEECMFCGCPGQMVLCSTHECPWGICAGCNLLN
jgi:hypothetical protein